MFWEVTGVVTYNYIRSLNHCPDTVLTPFPCCLKSLLPLDSIRTQTQIPVVSTLLILHAGNFAGNCFQNLLEYLKIFSIEKEKCTKLCNFFFQTVGQYEVIVSSTTSKKLWRMSLKRCLILSTLYFSLEKTVILLFIS